MKIYRNVFEEWKSGPTRRVPQLSWVSVFESLQSFCKTTQANSKEVL